MRNTYLIAFLILSFITTPAFSYNRFELGTRGYLMDACQEALDAKNTFAAGYCHGTYNTVILSRLYGMTSLGTKWCPNNKDSLDTNIHLGIIIKWIKNHPKQWNTGESYYAIELALKEAYPCSK